jgi:hypothetical protein
MMSVNAGAGAREADPQTAASPEVDLAVAQPL